MSKKNKQGTEKAADVAEEVKTEEARAEEGKADAAEGVDSTGAVAGEDVNSALLKRLESMEELLRENRDASRKIGRYRTVMALLMACLVLVFGIGMYRLNAEVQKVTQDLPELIATTTETVHSIGSLDIESLNGTIQELEAGLAKMDFKALNDSIVDLQNAAGGLSQVMSIFG